MKIINSQEKQNLLLNRKEVRIDVGADITPSRSEAIKVVIEKFSCSEDVVNIIKIDSNFGTKVFTIIADIYGSKEAKELIAVKRKKEIEAEKKVEEKPAEKPVENNTQREEKEEKVPEQDSETKGKEDSKEESPGQEGEDKE